MGAFVIWLGLLLGTAFEGGFIAAEVPEKLNAALTEPLNIRINSSTLKTTGAFLLVYVVAMVLYLSTRGNTRPGEEHGSARWGKAGKLTSLYGDRKNKFANTILTSGVRIGRKAKKILANLNLLIIGGPGSGKSYRVVKPNLMQCDASYIVSDPKGELLRDIAPVLKAKGIPFTVLNLVDMKCSDGYNPFEYIRSDEDALKLVTNLIKNTTPKGSNSNDPFWERAETALVVALILFLKHDGKPFEQNFGMLMELINLSGAKEDNDDYTSLVDEMFAEFERERPGDTAVSFYKTFKQAAGKTAKSILVTAATRLAAFSFPELARLTRHDDMRLGELGKKQRYIFCVIPDADTSLNYVVGMLYTQAFQELYRVADNSPGGQLPVPVRIWMDEFANVALPDDFERILSTCRGREIYINIIIQNIAQLKALFKDGWETITGDCAALLYLGGNEQSTHKYVSEMLGKETIDTRTRGVSKGRQGSSSQNFQNAGRELLTPDEVRALDKNDALVFLQGERPVRDRKYSPQKHPNYQLSALGRGNPYKRSPKKIAVKRDLGSASGKYNITVSVDGVI